ncbi:TPA: hypothetical protein OMS29_004905 [Klebsiella aerogenes]|nr:hypothetical protein [Klebsiella oxytoca]HCR0085227.1 hypothetical protein [Klebsiella aerogenes]HCR0223725.1 hypothetical protein [Klebsiella aerogenes]HCR0512073.1 hypothetical protein [Klebsiella aerogenes]HCU2336676.1 hypothetical protein [Klebsiella aerogenes]
MFLRIFNLIIIYIILNTPGYATEIIVGPGKGIIWSGYPFNLTQSGTHGYEAHNYIIGLGYLYSSNSCFQPKEIVQLPEGFYGFKVTTGVYILPRARISGQLYYGMQKFSPTAFNHILSGTIGYPETKITDQNGTPWDMSHSDAAWCPRLIGVYPKAGEKKEISISGDWIIYVDGTQIPSSTVYKLSKPLEGLLRTIYTAVESGDTGSVNTNKILLSDISIRVIGVECNVNTQINVNFGDVLYDATQNAELASVISPFSVSCTQGTQPVTVNINASFRSNTGYYNGDATQLALTEGGGYITGEIGKGITGSGACASHPSSLNFSQVPIKLATLLATDPSIDENNTITWRLCSGGTDLPVGNINATTELSIVFS